MNRTNIFKKILSNTPLLFALLWLIPILWLVLVPLKPRGFSASAVDKLFTGQWTLDNFVRLLTETHFFLWFKNNCIVAISQAFISTALASFTAYIFSQMKFRGKSFLYGLLFISFMIPGEAMLIPLFKLVSIDMGLSNTFLGIILPGLTNIFSFVVIKNFYDSIPKDFRESAHIDGAGHFVVWMKIYLPMSFGVTMTMGILNLIGAWNSFTWPLLIINSPEKYTLPIALPQFQGAYAAIDLALPMAANFLATLPVVIFFLIFQKQILKIQMDGGIK